MFGKFCRLSIVVTVSLFLFGAVSNEVKARTYLVNGIASAVPFIGYGMNNLGKKIPGAKVFSYITSVEGNGIIKPNILADIEARYKKNPSEPINLIGISYGANMITDIASKLAARGIPVNYMGIIEGGSMKALKDNVKKADNFICTGVDCTRKKVRLSGGNGRTALQEFLLSDSHINLGNNAKMHNRVISNLR